MRAVVQVAGCAAWAAILWGACSRRPHDRRRKGIMEGYMRASIRNILIATALAGGCIQAGVASAETAAPPDAQVYIIYPHDGQKIRGTFPVRFGLRNMGVTHAGDTTANMGHHHLLVDAEDE